MKTVRVVFLLSLVFVSFLDALTDQANIWIDNGQISRSYHIDDWSTISRVRDGVVRVNGESIISFGHTIPHVLINNIPMSSPSYRSQRILPSLSLVGLSSSTGNLKENWDNPMLTISPNGGEFDTTIKISLNLIAPVGFKGNAIYKIDNGTAVKTPISSNNNMIDFHLYKNGTHTVSYKLESESIFKQASFTIISDEDDIKKDSDGDGIPDSIETELGFDPLDGSMQDSDGNGWSDFDELVRGNNLTDSDGDGWVDWDEVNLRHTDKNDKYSKPTAHSIYGVEYTVSSEAYGDTDILTALSRISFVDVGSTLLYDSTSLLDINLSTEYYNIAISPMIRGNLRSMIDVGFIPSAIRIPADIPIIERVQERDDDTNSSWVVKAFLASTKPLSIQGYYNIFKDTTPPNNFDASVFIRGFIDYLKAGVIVSKHVTVDKSSSVEVAVLEGAFKRREDSDRTLLLGNPDFPSVGGAYSNILNSLSLEGRDINSLYLDLQSMLDNELRNRLLSQFLPQNRSNTTEALLADYVAHKLSPTDLYKTALMSIISYDKAEESSSVWTPTDDSDDDGIDNRDEVLPPLKYTNPLKADSDDDGLNDGDDPCSRDSTNSCMDDKNSLVDSDGDNIVDTVDNCPFAKNPNQLDSDGDGIGDVCSNGDFVITNPRTTLHLLQGDSYTFEAKNITRGRRITPIWYMDGKPLPDSDTLRYQYFFTKSGSHSICIGGQNRSCVPIEVSEREPNSESLNIFAQSSVQEGETNHIVLVELELSQPLSRTVKYNYETEAISATEGEDYMGVRGSVIFRPQEVRKFISIEIIGDIENENSENFRIKVTGSDYSGQTEITIIDDDSHVTAPDDPVVSIDVFDSQSIPLLNNTTLEGNLDNNLTFRVQLDTPITKDGSLHYKLLPIVQLPTSYNSMVKTPIEGDLNFEVDDQIKEFNVTVIGDLINEFDNNFTIEFSNPVNMKFDNSQNSKELSIRIADDDPLPMVEFKEATYTTTEGGEYQIELQLSSKSYKNIELNLTLNDDSSAEDSIDMDIDDFNLSTYNIIIPFSTLTTNNYERVLDINISKNPDDDDNEMAIFDIDRTKNAIISHDKNSTTVIIHESSSPVASNPLSNYAFMAFDSIETGEGEELWMSDGTPPETKLLQDIVEGTEGSYPYFITRVGDGLLYFIVDGETGASLYVTNGVENNATLVYLFEEGMAPSSLIDVGDKLYFTLYDRAEDNMSIWSSEGTTETTVYEVDIFHGAEGSDAPMKDFWLSIGETLYFAANIDGVADDDIELYKFNTINSTLSLVKDIKSGEDGSHPHTLIENGGMLYFIVNDSEIWKSDGTEDGTEIFVTVDEGAFINEMAIANNILYYFVDSSSNMTLESINLSDGSSHTIQAYTDGESIGDMRAVNSHLVYISTISDSYSLIKVDGAEVSGSEDLSAYPYPMRVFDGQYFYAIDGNLYVTDGDISSVQLRVGESDNSESITFVDDTIDNKIFFTNNEKGLWVSDGTIDGTIELR